MTFHENWYQFGPPIKRIFMLMILGNNLECKLAAFDKFNLSLPSFMTVRLHVYFVCYLFYNIISVRSFLKMFLNNITGYESSIFNSSFIFKDEIKCDEECAAISNKIEKI